MSQGEADRITFALVLLNAGHMLFHVPASLEDVAGMQAVLADTGLQVTEIEFLGGWALDGDPAELEELVRRIEAVADAFGGRHVSAGERPAMSRTLAMNCGSVLSFQVPATCGFSPKARQIRETDDCDRPVSPAIVQVDQCVSCPGPFSVRTRVTTSSTCWSVIVRGARALGASIRPFIPPSMNRTRHLRADSRDTPVRSATAVSGATPR